MTLNGMAFEIDLVPTSVQPKGLGGVPNG